MFRRISYESYAAVFGTVYLGLMTNALLLVTSLPLVALLVLTDPATTWPLIAVAVPLAAPGVAAAFRVFREHAQGGTAVVRAFLAGWRASWRRATIIGALASAALIVLVVDLHLLGQGESAVVVVPALAVLAGFAIATALLALAGIAEVPHARIGEVLRAAAVLGARRWYLGVVSLLVLGVQFVLFTQLPAIALGVSAAPALYLVWANARFTLRPVLELDEAPAS